MSFRSLFHRGGEAIIDGLCDATEIPRVDFDRLTEERGDTGELGNEERTLGFGLTDDVLHTMN
jgi:hypothetical protein